MNTIKNNYKKIIFTFLTMASMFFNGCKNEFWDDTEKITFGDSPNLTGAVQSIKDSVFSFTYTLSSQGWLSYVVLEGEVTEFPDSSLILKNKVSNAVVQGNFKITASNLNGTVNVEGLEQYTKYTLFVVSADTLGVLSAVAGPKVFVTTDIHAPEIATYSPDISYLATVALGAKVILTFNEKIKLVDVSKIHIQYYDRISATVISSPVEGATVSGNKLTVNSKGSNGQYGFLSIESGAITDIIGLPFAGIESGLVGVNLTGYYWRFEYSPFTYVSTSPTNGAMVTNDGFSFKLKFNKRLRSSISSSYTRDMITIKYVLDDYTTISKVSAGNLVIGSDSTLTVKLPITPVNGTDISLAITQGAIVDIDGNPIQAITFGETVADDELSVHFSVLK